MENFFTKKLGEKAFILRDAYFSFAVKRSVFYIRIKTLRYIM